MLLKGKTQSDINNENYRISLEIEESQLQNYLKDTDWYVTRANEETGKPIPNDIKAERKQARDRISEIKSLLNVTN